MASLTQVAKQAGVSVTTASMVLNKGKRAERISPACAQRVREAAAKLGYSPNYHARSMKLGRAEVIGVALEISARTNPDNNLGQPFFGALIGAIEHTTRLAGYALSIIGPTDGISAFERGVQAMQERRLDGLIYLAMVSQAYRNIPENLADQPIILIQPSFPTRLPTVDLDGEAGVRLVVEHLAALGHKQVLWVMCPGESRFHQGRGPAFQEAAVARGLRVTACAVPPLNLQTTADRPKGRIESAADASHEALATLLRDRTKRDWTAVFCYNDYVALGVYAALSEAGFRIPADVSVVGFDDLIAPLMIPKLTSMNMLDRMGDRATSMLLDMIQDPAGRKKYRGHRELITPALVVRSSTGPAPS